MAGRAMRSGECTISGIASIMLDGAGSRANGSQPTSRPFSTSAVKAPQWASDGKRATVMGGPPHVDLAGRMGLLPAGLNRPRAVITLPWRGRVGAHAVNVERTQCYVRAGVG